jgi:hypothetical protein
MGMDRQYIREHQVIERYLKGQLSSTEEQEFEEAYLADQELLDELELVERLGDGLKRHGTSAALAPRRSAPWLRTLASPQLAAAASILFVVSLVFTGALYRENLSLRQGQGLTANGGVTRLLPIVGVRGASGIEVEAPGPNEAAVLLVDPGATSHDVYRAVVSRRTEHGATPVWTVDGLTVGYEDQVAVGMPGKLLTPGEYEIVVEGRMKDWPASRASEVAQRLAFKIIPKAAQR